MNSHDTAPWADLVRRWDAQQAGYIEARERMYDVLIDALAHLCPDPQVRVLDLACGPGAISGRLLARLPQARSVALDVDPVLLAIGQGALGDQGGRLRWVRADLREPTWPAALGADGAPGTFDAVVSSTALHWLDPADLVTTYRRCRELLRPGGVLLNADYLPQEPGGRIAAVGQALTEERQRRAVAAGAESWEAWWEAVAAEPALAAALAERQTLWPEGSRDEAGASLGFHEVALREAGFAEAGMIWQDLGEGVLLALS